VCIDVLVYYFEIAAIPLDLPVRPPHAEAMMDPGEIPELIELIDAFQHDIPGDELSWTYLADALATSSVRIALTWLPQEIRHQHTAEEIERQNRQSASRRAVQG
jgi:hypothetical protein